jgi:competence ComEA-like helix-hairpin-helix protein
MDDRAGQVDLNVASVEALIQLSGIGPALAQRIVAARPFENVEDLVRVQGIGPHTMERLRPFVGVSAGDEESPAFGAEGAPEEREPAVPEPSDRGGGIPAAPGEGGEVEAAKVEFKARAPETVLLPVSEPEKAEEVYEMEEREAVPEGDQAGAAEAEAVEAEAFETEGAGEDVAPWEGEPIPGFDDEVPFADEDIPGVDEGISVIDEGIPGVAQVPAAGAAPERKPPAVTRARVRGTAFLSIVLATLLATLLSLAILSYVNGGQLQYVTPDRFGELSARAEGLEAQAGVLAQDVEGLRKRLDNLEALSGRLSTVEQATERVQADLEAAAGEVEKLAAQASDLEAQAADLAQRAEEVEARVGTLEAQGSRAQAFLEGLAELMNTLFPPEESTP